MSKLRHRESWYSRTKKELEEMDYKEKYRIAFDKAKEIYEGQLGTATRIFLEQIFPELKESEDERIRKGIIKFLKSNEVEGLITYEARQLWVTYLEKQKEPRDYRKLYEEVVNSDWFKANYKGKSLGEDQPTNSEIPKVSKPEWTEADEKMLSVITYKISQHQGNDERSLFTPDEAEFICEIEDKFKSLRPSWKPSEEQMEALQRAVNKLAKTDVADSVRLSIMYDNLKKLM